jgi:transcriptional antiterminator RfaH
VTSEILTWHIIYTKSRYEKKVVEELHYQGIEAYCPILTKVNQWSDRKMKIGKPLFGSYSFVKVSESLYKKVLQVPGVVRYIFWCGKPAKISEGEVEGIKKMLDDFDHSQIEVFPLVLNDEVVIKSGPFQNYKAEVLKINGNRIELIIESIGLKISIKQNQTELGKAV